MLTKDEPAKALASLEVGTGTTLPLVDPDFPDVDIEKIRYYGVPNVTSTLNSLTEPLKERIELLESTVVVDERTGRTSDLRPKSGPELYDMLAEAQRGGTDMVRLLGTSENMTHVINMRQNLAHELRLALHVVNEELVYLERKHFQPFTAEQWQELADKESRGESLSRKELAMIRLQEDKRRFGLPDDRRLPRGEDTAAQMPAEDAEMYQKLLSQFNEVLSDYVENQSVLAHQRLVRTHGRYMEGGAEMREVLSEKEMNALYPQGDRWVNPHKEDAPVVLYYIPQDVKDPEVFSVARGAGVQERDGFRAGSMGEWAYVIDAETDKWLRNAGLVTNSGTLERLASPVSNVGATPLAADNAFRPGDRGHYDNGFTLWYRFHELGRMTFVSMIGELKADLSQDVDGAFVTPKGAIYKLADLVTHGYSAAGRIQTLSPVSVKVPERDADGAIIMDPQPDGSEKMRIKETRQPFRGAEYLLRSIETAPVVPVSGLERSALDMQQTISKELFGKVLESFKTKMLDLNAYVDIYERMQQQTEERKELALRELIGNKLYDQYHAVGGVGMLRHEEFAVKLGELGLLSRYLDTIQAFDIVKKDLKELEPSKVVDELKQRVDERIDVYNRPHPAYVRPVELVPEVVYMANPLVAGTENRINGNEPAHIENAFAAVRELLQKQNEMARGGDASKAPLAGLSIDPRVLDRAVSSDGEPLLGSLTVLDRRGRDLGKVEITLSIAPRGLTPVAPGVSPSEFRVRFNESVEIYPDSEQIGIPEEIKKLLLKELAASNPA